MSNLVHIFTGTVEEVFPAGWKEDPFSSGFSSWHYGTRPYRVAAVNGGDGIGRLLCYATGRLRNRRNLAKQLLLNSNAKLEEIVLAAYKAWGAEYPKKLEGPVFTAVMDKNEYF